MAKYSYKGSGPSYKDRGGYSSLEKDEEENWIDDKGV